MRVEQQPAFILHARPWRETSLLLEVLSRDYGRLSLVARGVRRDRPHRPRAVLQPLIPLALSWSGRGELATLVGVEATGPVLGLGGGRLLCALYVNELVARLVPRHDPQPALFADYVMTLQRLARGEADSWTLRRFERDLLAHLGYGLSLAHDAQSGAPLEADRDYVYLPECGPVPWREPQDGLRLRGSALLALAADRQPAAEDLTALKRLLRAMIGRHLEGGRLNAWQLQSQASVRPPPRP